MVAKESEFVPKWIAWEITARCNLHCIHCRSSSDLGSHPGDFTTLQAYRLLEDIAAFAKPVVVLSGGEPLLREDVYDLIRHGTGLGLRMCLATNGVLVDDQACVRMKEAGVRIVSLSLDGSTKEIHDNFRDQEGAFEGVMRATDHFRRHGIEFIINSSFTRRNQDDIAKVYRLAKELGATAWYMFMIVPTGRGEDISSELISKEDYEKILKWHYQMEKTEKDMLVRPTCAPHYYRIIQQEAKREGQKFERRSLKFSTGGAKGCIAAQSIAFIDSRGNVSPCSYFPEVAGNVKTKSFKEIWETAPLFLALRDFKRYKGKCGQCEYLNVCGGCRARADAIYGDYLAEEPFCTYIPVRARKGGGDVVP